MWTMNGKMNLDKQRLGSFNGQASTPTLLIVTLAIPLLFFLFTFLFGIYPGKLLIFILALAAFLVALVNTNASLVVLIFSMLLSPEIPVGEVGAREIVIRIDDILLLIISFTWIVKMAINKQLGFLKVTPLNKPLLLFIAVCTLSTIMGILKGNVSPASGFFYILKYFEYYLLFFMVVNNISSLKQIKRFTIFFFIVCAIIAFYTYPQIIQGTGRVTAPFEGRKEAGEPNTLGGYLVFLLAISVGIALNTKSIFWKLFSFSLITAAIPAFLYTQSRGSYLGFIFMYLALLVLCRKKRVLLVGILLASILLSPFILPDIVTKRVKYTFTPKRGAGEEYEVLGRSVKLEYAAAARVQIFQIVLKRWKERPFLGFGVTGLQMIDMQYARVLAETGILGLWVFIWLLITVFKVSFKALKVVDDSWSEGLIMGFTAGYVGLLFHGLAASTFIIVRIMEPFWFFMAMVTFLSEKESE